MSTAVSGVTGPLRLTLVTERGRLDLAVPGGVPVGRLLPELARTVGLAADDSPEAHLLRADGSALDPGLGLHDQGVVAGERVRLASSDWAEPRHDDVALATAEVVVAELPPWRPPAGRRTALGVGCGLLLLAGLALLRVGEPAAPVAGLVAVVLVCGAGLISRVRRAPGSAAIVGWVATGYAALAGLLVGGGALGSSLRGAGIGAAAAGLACAAGVVERRVLAGPPVVLGVLTALAGLLLPGVVRPDVVLVSVMTAAVIAGSLLPWLALSVAAVRPDPPWRGVTSTPAPAVDAPGLRSGVLLADQVLLAAQATVGLLALAVLPVTVGLGAWGAVLGVLCCLVLLLRTRHHASGAQLAVGLVAGVTGLAVVAVTAVVQRPGWSPVVGGLLAVAGLVVLALMLAPPGLGVRRGWWGDLAESLVLVALLPVLAVATGLLDAVGR